MTRPNYVNVYVPPGGHREAWLKAVCDRLGLDHNHRDYLVAIDAALAAMVAGMTKGEGEMGEKSGLVFMVASELEYYGDTATEQDVADFAEFARQYLTEHGYPDVEIEWCDRIGFETPDEHWLREKVWDAWNRQ